MKYIFPIYQWLIGIPIAVVLTILTALSTMTGCFLGSDRIWGYYPPKIWSRLLCWLMFVKVRVKGRENIKSNVSYVFVANHQGAFDIWAIYGFLNHNFKWLMKKSLHKIPLVGKACNKAGHVFVDDSSISGIRDTITEAEGRLRNGMSVVIFPEGSRSWDGCMTSFRRGAFMLAGEFKLPVVPITIDGSFKAMPRFSKNITPCTITLTIHKPIEPKPNGFNTKQLMAQCYENIESALPLEYRRKK